MFTFADLFAGIGGFHAALGALGGECWFASEIDRSARRIYEHNWHGAPPAEPGDASWVAGDIVPLTTNRMKVPPTDVLAAGFPCQPFSKSGFQRGMNEARGTLFWNILRVLEEHQPAVVLLENVRNIAGPRHDHEWKVIIRSLRQLGYRVSQTAQVFSPHLLPRRLGGRPQVRERVFITATFVGERRVDGKRLADLDIAPLVTSRPVEGWDPQNWHLEADLPLQDSESIENLEDYVLTEMERHWVDVWEDLVNRLIDRLDGERLPGFPIWADEFVLPSQLDIPPGTPGWKRDFLEKNARFYRDHQAVIDAWKERHQDLAHLPPSRRKLEWQAQDTGSLWDTVMHFRPSGIRAKRSTYLPALVAITQTSIVGKDRASKRRITPREAARLQGLPDWFEFRYTDDDGQVVAQPDAASYKQMGNGVNVGAAYYVLRRHIIEDADLIADRAPGLVESVLAAHESPDVMLQESSKSRPLSVGPQSGGRGPVPDQARKTQAEMAAQDRRVLSSL